MTRREPRHLKLGREHVAACFLAEKRMAHPVDDVADRRKIDGNLIRKTGVRRRVHVTGPPGGPQRMRTIRFAMHNDPIEILSIQPTVPSTIQRPIPSNESANDRSGPGACQDTYWC